MLNFFTSGILNITQETYKQFWLKFFLTYQQWKLKTGFYFQLTLPKQIKKLSLRSCFWLFFVKWEKDNLFVNINEMKAIMLFVLKERKTNCRQKHIKNIQIKNVFINSLFQYILGNAFWSCIKMFEHKEINTVLQCNV